MQSSFKSDRGSFLAGQAAQQMENLDINDRGIGSQNSFGNTGNNRDWMNFASTGNARGASGMMERP